MRIKLQDIAKHTDQSVTIEGWLADKSSKGKLAFLRIRDGSGFIQATVFKNDVSQETFERSGRTLEPQAVTNSA
jgi:asparaginyl-tRNA synthetase